MSTAHRAGGLSRYLPRTRRSLGATAIVLLLLLAVCLYQKASIVAALRGGQTVTALFDRDYQIRPDKTKVKYAGLEVGLVTDLDHEKDGSVKVHMKVDDDVYQQLGRKPSAEIAPKTLLGGEYAIELRPGGEDGAPQGVISSDRTRVPVELDRVLEALPRPTRASLQRMVGRLDQSVDGDGGPALKELVKEFPVPMQRGGDVLRAARGRNPDSDLSTLVTDLDNIASVLSSRRGQLDRTLNATDGVTGALAARSPHIGSSLQELPAAMANTRQGMAGLRTSLAELERTAPDLRPTAQALSPLLKDLTPVLVKARPLMAELRPLMADARPVVDDLVPVVRDTDQVVGDVQGPVINRVKGPILDKLMNTWRGTGPYAESGRYQQANHKFYEEIGYLVANMDRASMTQTANGSTLSFQVGVGGGFLQGLPLNLTNLLETITDLGGTSR